MNEFPILKPPFHRKLSIATFDYRFCLSPVARLSPATANLAMAMARRLARVKYGI